MRCDVLHSGAVIAGKYVVEEELGRGGMGVVFAARNTELELRVALKTLMLDGRSAEDQTKITSRFEREARIIARLRSDHVARVFDVVRTDDGIPCIVMECLSGETLADRLRSARTFPPSEALRILRQVCLGVSEAHRAGVVHRDLKPSNIFLVGPSHESTAKVLDFGVAKVVAPSPSGIEESTLTATDSLIGSPSYMSPEQVRGLENVDARSDIWSLGVILYEMIAGRRPFVGDTFADLCLAVIASEPAPVERTACDVAVRAIIDRCLKKEREERFASVEELIAAIDEARAGAASDRRRLQIPRPLERPTTDTTAIATSEEATPPPRRLMSGFGWVAAGALIVFAIAGAGVARTYRMGRSGAATAQIPSPSTPRVTSQQPVADEPPVSVPRVSPPPVAASASAPASTTPRPPAAAPRPKPATRNCDAPVEVDENGHRRYRRECL